MLPIFECICEVLHTLTVLGIWDSHVCNSSGPFYASGLRLHSLPYSGNMVKQLQICGGLEQLYTQISKPNASMMKALCKAILTRTQKFSAKRESLILLRELELACLQPGMLQS